MYSYRPALIMTTQPLQLDTTVTYLFKVGLPEAMLSPCNERRSNHIIKDLFHTIESVRTGLVIECIDLLSYLTSLFGRHDTLWVERSVPGTVVAVEVTRNTCVMRFQRWPWPLLVLLGLKKISTFPIVAGNLKINTCRSEIKKMHPLKVVPWLPLSKLYRMLGCDPWLTGTSEQIY